MELSAQKTTCDGWELALKVIQVRTNRQAILATMFGDVGPFEGRKPLIPGYMFVSQDTWPIADGVVGFVGLVSIPDLDAFVAAIREDRAKKRQSGPLDAFFHNGVLTFLGRELHLRGGSLVESH